MKPRMNPIHIGLCVVVILSIAEFPTAAQIYLRPEQHADGQHHEEDPDHEQIHALFENLTEASNAFNGVPTAEATNRIVQIATDFKTEYSKKQIASDKSPSWPGTFLAGTLSQAIPMTNRVAPLLVLRSQFQDDAYDTLRQGIDVVLLQTYYHLSKWDEGISIISGMTNEPIKDENIVSQVNGFCSGLIRTGQGKRACELYKSFCDNLDRIKDQKHEPEDCLMMLANFYGLNAEGKARFDIYQRLKEKHPSYFKQHQSEVEYFEFLALTDMGEKERALNSLVSAAKALTENPTQKLDPGVGAQITNHVVTYKEKGWLGADLDLKIATEIKDGKRRLVSKMEPPVNRRSLWIGLFLISPLLLSVFVWKYTQKRIPSGDSQKTGSQSDSP